MKKTNLKIGILPNAFLCEDGTFDKESAITLSGKIAGVCYDKEGFTHLENEPIEKTMRRVDMTLNNGHHSVYDHISISLNLQNIPKILAMVINNEKQYTTSEKSARYTPVVRQEGSIITLEEQELYNKWIDIFKVKIGSRYGEVYNEAKIQKLAQENARYLVTVFMPTQMIYTTSFRQINYIASWMEKYIACSNPNSSFESKLSDYMRDFIDELGRLNILEKGLLGNEKHRELSLFGKKLSQVREYYGNVYSTTYKGSFAQLAQAHRHRTLDYQIELLDNPEYFVPPIIEDDSLLVDEWLRDIRSLSHINPQGELVLISEMGKFEDFILKCKERLCTGAQLEIMRQTRETLVKYKNALEETDHPYKNEIVRYMNGARCTFSDFECTSDCEFKEGKTLKRII